MKIIFAIIFTLSFHAQAQTIGDWAYFEGHDEIYNKKKISYFLDWTLQASKRKDHFFWQVIIQGPQQTTKGGMDMNIDDLNFEVIRPDLIDKCEENGFTRELVQVPAGTFDSCIFVNDGSDYITKIWHANVPFGRVKSHIVHKKSKKEQSTELLMYSSGTL